MFIQIFTVHQVINTLIWMEVAVAEQTKKDGWIRDLDNPCVMEVSLALIVSAAKLIMLNVET